ncbi:MAG: hypothetical protein RBT45_05015 [Acholeplasmataceae bacterium]|nr:hypothetical protein [Acholeplasmataceae bacterium]
MPKCVKCFGLYHPDWCVEENIRGDEVIICCFCKMDKNELTVVDDNDKIVEVITKEQAKKNYLKFLDDLSKKPKIAEILVKDKV